MTDAAARFARVKAIWLAAADVPPDALDAFLDRECEGDPALRAEVAALFAVDLDHAFDGDAARRAAGWFGTRDESESDDGARIGPFRTVRELGRGGMGVVYEAQRVEGGFEQRVALKRLRAAVDTRELRARFDRERRILASLEHPNIARLLDGGVDAHGRPWFAMEYVEGESIAAHAGRNALGARARVLLFRAVLEAVGYAHRHLVVHRDLKPGNVLVTQDDVVKLLDFGIAKLLDDDGDAALTETGARLMTPAYAAPEQLLGEPVTTATDVYSLGVMLYELLAGRSPYREASSRGALEHAVLQQEPARITHVTGRRLDRELDHIVRRALQKSPQDRYPGVDAFAADLDAWLDGRTVRSARLPFPHRVRKFVRRHRLGVAISAALVASIAGGVGATLWQANEARRQAETATAMRVVLSDLFTGADPALAESDEPITVAQLLDDGTRRIERDIDARPDVMVPLLGDLAAVYASIGQASRAKALFERALAATAKLERADPVLESVLRIGLVDIALETADYDEAKRLGKLLPAPDSLDRAAAARVRQSHARVAGLTGDLAGATVAWQAAVASERAPPVDRDRLASALAGLGDIQYDAGDYQAAVASHRESLALTEAAHGPRSPERAIALHNLAIAMNQAGDGEAAAAMLRESADIHRAAFGADHWHTVLAEGELAVVLNGTRRFDEARTLFERVIAWHRANRAPDHPRLGGVLQNYGVMLYGEGRYAEAEKLFAESYPIFRAKRGEDHPHTVNARTALAACRAELGDVARAEPELREALAQRRTAGTLNTLGILLRKSGRADEAVALHDEALAQVTEEWKGDERHVAWPLALRAAANLDAGRLEAAREDAEKVVAMYAKQAPQGGPRRSFAELTLGRVLVAQGERERGIAMVRGAREMRRGLFGDDNPLVAEATRVLDELRASP